MRGVATMLYKTQLLHPLCQSYFPVAQNVQTKTDEADVAHFDDQKDRYCTNQTVAVRDYT